MISKRNIDNSDRRSLIEKERGSQMEGKPSERYKNLQEDLIYGNEQLVQNRHRTVLADVHVKALNHRKVMEERSERSGTPVVGGASNWVQLGPTAIPKGQTYGGPRVLVSGRLTSIAINPASSTTIYSGTARGGVWKTTDGGLTWNPKSDNEISLAIGALAIAPSNPDVVYAGTGEGNLQLYVQSYPLNSSPDNFLGNGLLKSINGGNSWTLQGTGNFNGAGFYRIAVHPSSDQTAFAATSNGLFRTINGGTSWEQMTNGLPAISASVIAATDVVIDPSNPDKVYVSFWADGIYRSLNATSANPTWNKITIGLPSSNMSRIALGISASSPENVYAFIADALDGVEGLYQTVIGSGGDRWTPVTLGSLVEAYGAYTLNLVVDPTTPDIIYLSGVSLYKGVRNPSTNTWTFTDVGGSIHPDNHAFAVDPINHLIVYAGTDGGFYKSTDGGINWDDSVNEGLCLTQFEYMDQHPVSDAIVFGGTQDNGTEQFRNSPVFYHAADGDGGCVAIDQTNPTNVIHEYYSETPERSVQGGKFETWSDVSLGIVGSGLFYPPFALDRVNQSNIAFGTDGICLDGSQGTGGWTIVVPLPGIIGKVSAVCYVNSSLIYVGTTSGQVYRLDKSGTSWSAIAINSSPLPSRWIWDISTLPGDDDTVILAMSGFGTGHVWRGVGSTSATVTWTDISGSGSTGLPDIPVFAIVIDTTTDFYVGTDIGVFKTTDSGSSWTNFNQGMPNCAVYDLRLHGPTRLIRAATHGRGLWERKLDVSSMPERDIYVRDHIMATARIIPSPSGILADFEDSLQHVAFGTPLWWFQCSDIKVDSLEGSPPSYQMDVPDVNYLSFECRLEHRNARRGTLNHIYVQVHNRGTRDANVIVKILYAGASAGLPDLPADFWASFPGDSSDLSNWKPIGTATTTIVSPSVPSTIEWDWVTPVSAADHSCLLVIADSLDDPIPSANKVLNIAELVSNEKHVGLKNIHIVSAGPGLPYWTSFMFHVAQADKRNIRVLSSKDSGWISGFCLRKEVDVSQNNMQGFSIIKPTDQMIYSLEKKIGNEIANYDIDRLYLIDESSKESVLKDIIIDKLGTEIMLMFMPQIVRKKRGTITILQEDGKKIDGGSTFVLEVE